MSKSATIMCNHLTLVERLLFLFSYAPTEIFKTSIMLVHWGRTDLNHQ